MSIKRVSGIVAIGLVLAACSGLGKMQKCIVDVKFDAQPNPQEAKGGQVATNIKIQFPERYFDKKSKWEITPTLVYAGGEKAYKPFYVQGEKFAGNDKEISFKSGGSVSYTGEIPFEKAMEVSTLELRIKGFRGVKTKNYDKIKVADGTISTPYLIQNDFRMFPAPHQFERVRKLVQKAEINFAVNADEVRAAELTDADMVKMKGLLATIAKNKNYSITSIDIEAYASPEGELRKNENLANDRAKAARKALSAQFAAVKLSENAQAYTLTPKGEDWEGFKEMMKQSKIADKDLILRILTMYEDVAKREQEIRNLSATFTEVSEQILPKLRRAVIRVNYEIVGKSDEEIKRLTSTNPKALDADELQYAATLTSNLSEQQKIYEQAEKQFSDDVRGTANVAYILLKNGNKAAAKTKLQDACAKGDLSAANNLGVVELEDGNGDKAESYFNKAKVEFAQSAYNLGLMKITSGDYATASQLIGSELTFNAALAQCLNGEYEKAAQTLAKSKDKDSALSNYLAGVVAARAGKQEVMIEKLTEAVKLDNALKQKVKTDAEFIKYRENAAFKALVK